MYGHMNVKCECHVYEFAVWLPATLQLPLYSLNLPYHTSQSQHSVHQKT